MILAACHWWIVGLWVLFFVYWASAALLMRGTLRRSAFRSGMATRFALVVVIAVAINLARRWAGLQELQWTQLHSLPMALTGAILATLGAAVAFSARAAIGRNWGPPQTRRTDTQLVTSGPYAVVRHPIYSGMLLMMIGTAIGLMPAGLLVAAAAGVYFFVSARAEEKHMAERFPDDYPAYRARTKMLIPFVL